MVAKDSNPKPLPTAEYLRERLVYDPDTGVLAWKPRPQHHFKSARAYGTWNARYAGKSAGDIQEGRIRIAINHIRYMAHRIIWKMQTGDEPRELDHKDRDGTNNRWTNLRVATRPENLWNSTRARKLPRGVSRKGNRYCARMSKAKSSITLGWFDTPEEAHEAWCAAVRDERGEFFKPD